MTERWVDLQVNGCRGVDFSSPELTGSDFMRAAEAIFASGTEVFLPTVVTASSQLYRRNLPLIKRTVEEHGIEERIPGIHLEGPMITFPGAHDPALIRECSAEGVRRLWETAGGFVAMMTFAADGADVSGAATEALRLGIIPSAGHHNAGYADVAKAADAGVLTLTHLGNACPNLLPRHENPLLAGLAEDRMTAMIITDGHHLPPELIKLILKVKGPEKLIVTSDMCHVCGLPPGEYRFGATRGVLTPEGKFWNPEGGYLMGAAVNMHGCMEFLRSLEVLDEAELLDVGRNNALRLLAAVKK